MKIIVLTILLISLKISNKTQSFKELWDTEFYKYFNNNLIVFHNSSMDLSVLKNLFKYYSIKEFSIEYIDTMYFAKKIGHPTKLKDLASKYEIKFQRKHDPKEDAEVCALIFGELIDEFSNYKDFTKKIEYTVIDKESRQKQNKLEIENTNIDYINKYSVTEDELKQIKISEQNFLFTGTLNLERHLAKEFITKNGGFIKSGITSKVNYVVIGVGYGWSKIQKIHQLNSNKGLRILILTNSNFEYLLKKYATSVCYQIIAPCRDATIDTLGRYLQAQYDK